jgi:hypothetical protein
MADIKEVKEKTRRIYEALPKLDDQRCGYRTCGEFARAVAEGNAPCDGCVSGGPEVAAKVCGIMGVKVPAGAIPQSGPRPRFYPPGFDRYRGVVRDIGGGMGRGMGRGFGRGGGGGRGGMGGGFGPARRGG